MSGLSLKMKNKIKKKRGRPKLSNEERARRKAEREEAKAKARNAAPKKRVTSKKFLNEESNQEKIKDYLLTPAGRCPVELYGHDKEAISIWLSQAKNCRTKGTVHTVQSLTYWLRYYFGIFSEEYKIASENVKELSAIFEIKDYEPILKKVHESILAKNNLKTIEEYIETGEVK